MSTLRKRTGRLCSGGLEGNGKGDIILELVDDGESRLDSTAVGDLNECGVEVEKEEMVAWT